MKTVYLLIIGGLLCCPILSQGQNSPTDMIDQFFTKYKEDPAGAVDLIFSFNPRFSGPAKEQATNVRLKLEELLPLLGSYHGFEALGNNKIGESLYFYRFMIKYDTQPMLFTFKFYRPDKSWLLMGFAFNDRLLEEIERQENRN